MALYGLSGQKLKATLELPDGTVFSGSGYVAQISQTLITDDLEEWTMELSGLGEPLWQGTRTQAVERQHKQMSAIEWACDYCGSVWPKATTKCIQCGGHRSFVYDV